MAAAQVSTSTSSDAYQVSHQRFNDIIRQEEPIRLVAEKDYPFAHEAPVGIRGLNKLFFVSNRLGDKDSPNQHIQLQTLDLSSGHVEVLPSQLTNQLPMPNGATNWPGTDDCFVLLTQGQCDVRPAVNKVNLRDMTCEVLLNSYQGKQLNSPNDVVVYKDGTIWFTDPPYGHAQNFRPEPELGNRVYAFNPTTGDIQVLAEKFVKPNGIVFSPDYTTVYVTDTGDKNEDTAPRNQTIYAFDVVQPDSSSSSNLPSPQNRRVFATVESEQPDGIKVDCKGNVYTGTKGGIEVFAPDGTKLGTICCGHTTNLAFVDDTLYAMCEQKIVAIKLQVAGASLP
jgi:gluconolactonase